MKYLLYIIFVFSFFGACRVKKQIDSKTIDSISFDWMLGYWKRANGAPGQETYEIWRKAGASTYSGKGFTLVKGDTVFLENVTLQNINKGEWVLNVSMKGEKQATIFKVENTTPTSFYCTNMQNSFPKRIEYEILGDTLMATISGGAPSVLFKFVKQ